MQKLLVCYKWVLDEQDIKIAGDLSLDTSRAKYKISDYDKNAIEEGVLLAEQHGVNVEALTFGSAAAKQSLKTPCPEAWKKPIGSGMPQPIRQTLL